MNVDRRGFRLIIQAVEQIREGIGPDGNWMIDLIEAMTEAASGPTHRRPDGSLTHW